MKNNGFDADTLRLVLKLYAIARDFHAHRYRHGYYMLQPVTKPVVLLSNRALETVCGKVNGLAHASVLNGSVLNRFNAR